MEKGTYRISLCRYPRESGLAINDRVPAREATLETDDPMPASNDVNFTGAQLSLGDFNGRAKISGDMKEASFDVFMQEGRYDVEAVLTDESGLTTTAYYVYIEKL